MSTANPFEQDLGKNDANFVALSPLTFLKRAARVFPDKAAVIHGDRRTTYRELRERVARFASALVRAGVGKGDTVAVMAPNVPALLEAHYGIPLAGAVLNAINTRLDAASVGFILRHSGAKVLIADRDYAELIRKAVAGLDPMPLVVDHIDLLGKEGHPDSMRMGSTDYEAFLAGGDPAIEWKLPDDEWQAITLNYTSGTTGDPKGVVYSHRGAYLNALGNVMAFGLSADAVYLWTLPMFHCNGWTYPWAVTAAAATHVCLRAVDPPLIFELIRKHRVTHLCGAPIVLNMLAHSPKRPAQPFEPRVEVATGGAAPPSAVIEAMESMGFRVTHLYGLTESYGPATLCQWQEEWGGLELSARAQKMARQGVAMPTQEDIAVLDVDTGKPLPADGKSLGEIALRGNTIMKGYFRNARASGEVFRDGWFRSGDLGVMHPDGYIEIKDRAKDIIISGGENISTLEVEEVLYRHPQVMEAAVVAKPDEKWGETPCAFVTLKPGAQDIGKDEVIKWCREHLAGYKVPRYIVFSELPKTSTGKIQKFVLRERAKGV